MFKVKVDATPEIAVTFKNKLIKFAIDASAANPLEATYAALAGCAAVYAKKACKRMNIDPSGIEIDVSASILPNNSIPSKINTNVTFDKLKYTEAQIHEILTEIENCAVKELLLNANAINFVVNKL